MTEFQVEFEAKFGIRIPVFEGSSTVFAPNGKPVHAYMLNLGFFEGLGLRVVFQTMGGVVTLNLDEADIIITESTPDSTFVVYDIRKLVLPSSWVIACLDHQHFVGPEEHWRGFCRMTLPVLRDDAAVELASGNGWMACRTLRTIECGEAEYQPGIIPRYRLPPPPPPDRFHPGPLPPPIMSSSRSIMSPPYGIPSPSPLSSSSTWPQSPPFSPNIDPTLEDRTPRMLPREIPLGREPTSTWDGGIASTWNNTSSGFEVRTVELAPKPARSRSSGTRESQAPVGTGTLQLVLVSEQAVKITKRKALHSTPEIDHKPTKKKVNTNESGPRVEEFNAWSTVIKQVVDKWREKGRANQKKIKALSNVWRQVEAIGAEALALDPEFARSSLFERLEGLASLEETAEKPALHDLVTAAQKFVCSDAFYHREVEQS